MKEVELRISKIVEETADTRSFYLERLDGSPIAYKAGQFLTLLFHINGREVRRSYSLGSAPDYETDFFITIKRTENGEISRKLLDSYKVGDILTCLLPSGLFIKEIKWQKELHYFFFAAGSGIVPIFGILKSILHENPSAKVFLLNQVTSENKIIYQSQLEDLKNKYSGLEYILYLSQPIAHNIPVQRLNNLQVERLVDERLITEMDRQNARFFLCGPTTFMRMVKFTLKLDGFQEEQIKQEKFVIQEYKSVLPLMTDTSEKKVVVKSKGKISEFIVAYPETILAAGKKANIILPFSCEAGQCSTCAVRCTEGNVLMGHNDILTQKDLENGWILTCTGHPATDIVLDYTLKNE